MFSSVVFHVTFGESVGQKGCVLLYLLFSRVWSVLFSSYCSLPMHQTISGPFLLSLLI